jgi:hypothetical protein
MKIFFATDLHGSEVCFRKLCEAADFYGCQVLIMGGDVTGKLLVPITVNGEQAMYELGGEPRTVPKSQLADVKKRISNMGYYAIEADQATAAELETRTAYEKRLLEEARKRASRWVEYAEERLGGSDIRIFFAPGNDDDPSVDSAFEGSTVFVNAEKEVLTLEDFQLVTSGWSNPTPWETPRECAEEELESRLRALVEQIDDPDRAIFNFHVPPYGTSLDLCPKIDKDFRVVTVMGNPIQVHAGSTAVRTLIEEYQPLVSLHGHIHESRNVAKLGRTVAINPGSEYSEGILMGVIVTLAKGKAEYTFTAG